MAMDRRKVPFPGATSMRHDGAWDIGLGAPWRSTRSRAASRSSGVFNATTSTAGKGPLGQPRERSCGRHFDDCADAKLAHGLHAAVPAHGAADLDDEPSQDVAAVLHHRAVGVGQQPDASVVGGDRPGVLPSTSTAGSM